MIRPIAIYPEPILSQPSRPVTKDDKLEDLIRDLCDTLAACQTGAALHAIQIGVPLQVFVMKADKNKPHRVMLNANISKLGEATQTFKEGCLSMPGVFENVQRATEVEVDFESRLGTVEVETFKGFEAFVIQHEIQHQEGYTIHDLVDKVTRKRILNKMKKWKAKGIYYPMGSKLSNRLWEAE